MIVFSSPRFTCLQEQFCFINNACVSLAVANPDNPCEVCNFNKDKYRWTIKQGKYCNLIKKIICTSIPIANNKQLYNKKWKRPQITPCNEQLFYNSDYFTLSICLIYLQIVWPLQRLNHLQRLYRVWFLLYQQWFSPSRFLLQLL